MRLEMKFNPSYVILNNRYAVKSWKARSSEEKIRILYNVLTNTLNALDLSMHGCSKELINAWKNTKIDT